MIPENTKEFPGPARGPTLIVQQPNVDPMPRYLKYALIGLGALVVLLVAIAAIVAATFDPNDYKPLLVKLVQEKKQRTLDIPGRIRLTFFPKIGADLGKVSLSERGSKGPFASVDSARVSVALLPLLRKQVVVDRLKIDGIRANLKKRKDGSTNFDDLAGGEEKTPAKDQQVLVLAVDGVDLTNADIAYEDEAAGARYELAGATLKVGKLGDGVSDDFSFKGRVRSKSPTADAEVSLKTKYTMDLSKKQVRLKDLVADIGGTLADLKDLAAGLSANADIQISPLSASLSAVAVSFKAKQPAGELAAKLDVPALKYAATKCRCRSSRPTSPCRAPRAPCTSPPPGARTPTWASTPPPPASRARSTTAASRPRSRWRSSRR